MDYEIVVPDPAGTIESLSALGYSLEAAVADIVDNSIDADASRVDVLFHWAGEKSYVVIADDGFGMTEAALKSAMALGERGPQVRRSESELGRFGMGLKTASFSQASQLTVWTRPPGGMASTRVWDLDAVIASGEWRLLREPDPLTADLLADHAQREHGTVVVWRNLAQLVTPGDEHGDESAHRLFFDLVSKVEEHLGMVFCRFLSSRPGRRRLKITVNGAEVGAWDPFLQSHHATLRQPEEHLQANGRLVLVSPFILPPKRMLTDEWYRRGAGPRGWLDQQGFYVFRNDRLIVAGDWLGLGLRKDEKHVLARVAVDVPADLDGDWAVDVKKASARPPLSLQRELRRIGRSVRTKAQAVLTHVGRTATVMQADELSFAWRPDRADGELRVRMNWEHPLVKDALRLSGDGRSTVRSLLRFLEETVPVPALRVLFDEEEDRDYTPFTKVPTDEVLKVAEGLFAAYLNSGLTPAQAIARLTNTYPFNEYPDITNALGITSNSATGRQAR